jgi:4-alpha-glucanotransferase
MSDRAVRELARRAGVEVEWANYAGEPRTVSVGALRRVLSALGLPCATKDDLTESRHRLAPASGLQGVPPLVTGVARRTIRLPVKTSKPLAARLLLATGDVRNVSAEPVGGGLEIPSIVQPGYHRLLIGNREIVLAVAPARETTIDALVPHSRLWGLAAQVYGLRRRGDGGVGDAAGVAELAASAAHLGADALALSPVHALFHAEPRRYSPYSPSSRLFLNPLYAAPELVFGVQQVGDAIARAGVAETYARLERLDLVDWAAASGAKYALFRALFDRFMAREPNKEPLHADFAQFRADGGSLLADHACFEALHAECLQLDPDSRDWRTWAIDLRMPNGPVVVDFAQSHHHEILFHMFLQWLADRSFGATHTAARQAGMRIGLIADLAVGMDPAGSHAWSRQEDVLRDLVIGAPPDLLNPNGQDWGITGFAPRALIAGGFAPFLATVRAALRSAGGVRIDHIIGLQRLWLVPTGASPADGAFLNYPLTDLLRLLALESYRHRAVVIGEDLGTVPAGFREKLNAHGIHGMRVLWFERNGTRFVAPGRWDRTAVAMTSTHDLPTLASWWRGSDISERARHGLLGTEHNEADLKAERDGDRESIWRAFRAAGVARGHAAAPCSPDAFVGPALRFVAATPASLCLLPLEDVLGVAEQPNLPGTIDQHPNWRRRTRRSVDQLLNDPVVANRLRSITEARCDRGTYRVRRRNLAVAASHEHMTLTTHTGDVLGDRSQPVTRERPMARQARHDSKRKEEQRVDTAANDSFPASDPPSHSGITGVRRKPAAGARSAHANPAASQDNRPPPHERGQDSRPTGQPTSDRHATETAHSWEDEDKS